MNRARRIVRGLAATLLATGLVTLGYATYVIVDARQYQAMAERQFEQERQTPTDRRQTPTVSTAVVDGSIVGDVRIERIGLAAVVVQGESAGVLQRAVGHLAGTALPGQPGNVVLAGHRDTFFRPLAQVRVGDLIAVRTRDGEYEYQVDSTAVVPPNRVQVLAPTAERALTLITCYPFGYLGAAPDRFIVRARETARSTSRSPRPGEPGLRR